MGWFLGGWLVCAFWAFCCCLCLLQAFVVWWPGCVVVCFLGLVGPLQYYFAVKKKKNNYLLDYTCRYVIVGLIQHINS